MQYVIEIQGDKELARDLSKIARELGNSVDDILDASAASVESTMKGKSPSFTGELKSSVKVFRRTKDERWIGPTSGRSGSFPPSHYGRFVDQGGGPRGFANIDDIALRLGIDTRQAFAFAKYLRDSGKGVQRASGFVRDTAQQEALVFYRTVQDYINRIIR